MSTERELGNERMLGEEIAGAIERLTEADIAWLEDQRKYIDRRFPVHASAAEHNQRIDRILLALTTRSTTSGDGLVEALAPFADHADTFQDDEPDHMQDWPTFTAGDFRRARAAYRQAIASHQANDDAWQAFAEGRTDKLEVTVSAEELRQAHEQVDIDAEDRRAMSLETLQDVAGQAHGAGDDGWRPISEAPKEILALVTSTKVGWRLVPEEPTEEMLAAIGDAWTPTMRAMWPKIMGDIYRAMIAAAPTELKDHPGLGGGE